MLVSSLLQRALPFPSWLMMSRASITLSILVFLENWTSAKMGRTKGELRLVLSDLS